jgi:hypothetical protein
VRDSLGLVGAHRARIIISDNLAVECATRGLNESLERPVDLPCFPHHAVCKA